MEELIKNIKEKLHQYNIYKKNTINKEEDIKKLLQINCEEIRKLIEENESELFSYLKNKLQTIIISQYDLYQSYQNLTKEVLLGKSEEKFRQESSFIRVNSRKNEASYTEIVNFIKELAPFCPKFAKLITDYPFMQTNVNDYPVARGEGFILTAEAEIKEFMEDVEINQKKIRSIPRTDEVNIQDRNEEILRLEKVIHQFLRENQGVEILLKNIDVQRGRINPKGIKELEETLNLKIPSPFPAHLENDILRLSKKLEELKPKFQKAEESRAKENKGLKGHFDRFCEENCVKQVEEMEEEYRHKRGL